MLITDHPHWNVALEICQRLDVAGYQALFAGGCVRDHLLGREAHDLDLVTDANSEQLESLFERVIPVGKQFGVVQLVIGDVSLEVATFRADGIYVDGRRPVSVRPSSPREDAARRDFTINAMFLDPRTFSILDYVDGGIDLERRLIRTVGAAHSRFQEDHLRVLRAVRFMAQLDFQLEAETERAVVDCALLTASVSAERLRAELHKLFSGRALSKTRPVFIKSDLFKWTLHLSDAQNAELHSVLRSPPGLVLFDENLPLSPLERWVGLAYFCPSVTHQVPARLKWSREEGRIYTGVLRLLNDVPQVVALSDGALLRLRESTAGDTFLKLLGIFPAEVPHAQDLIRRVGALTLRWPTAPANLVDGHDLLAVGVPAGPALARDLERIYDLQLENPTWTHRELLNAFFGRQTGQTE